MTPESYDEKMDDMATKHPGQEIADAQRKGLIEIKPHITAYRLKGNIKPVMAMLAQLAKGMKE